MRSGESYKLRVPILGVLAERQSVQTLGPTTEHLTALTIPENAVVKLAADHAGDDRMVDVIWNGQTVTVFSEDLRARGDLLQYAAVA